MTEPLFNSSEWSFEELQRCWDEIEKIAHDEFRLSYYKPQIEIISSEQMLDAYASIGMPILYKHWSFGKHFVQDQQNYQKGYTGLAYEIVVNTAPLITFLMEENSGTMQALVLAHSIGGHGHFFKNNYLFKQWTQPDGIIDYLVFAQNYIKGCEEKYGYEKVEIFLDSCHALMSFGVDKYKRPSKLSITKEKEKQKQREEQLQKEINELWVTLPNQVKDKETKIERYPEEPQENILYFIEKKSPNLETWQREIIRIVRKLAQYWFPQRQTKTMNEGFACFMHYHIMYDLFEKGLLTEGNMQEFLISHTNVVSQPDFDSKRYSGINPYALGFDMLMDVKRICASPTEEDKEWFPEIVNKPYLDVILDIAENYRDESAIRQFLSPNLIRKWRMFKIFDASQSTHYKIEKIHNDRGYREIRNTLAQSYDVSLTDPDIQVWDVDLKGDRTLTLKHTRRNQIPLAAEPAEETLKHVARLWGYNVKLISYDPSENRIIKTFESGKPR